jgi:hypothetical protein
MTDLVEITGYDVVLAMLMAMIFGIWIGWQAKRLSLWLALWRRR